MSYARNETAVVSQTEGNAVTNEELQESIKDIRAVAAQREREAQAQSKVFSRGSLFDRLFDRIASMGAQIGILNT